jgi:monoamine oxidase
VVAHTVDGRTFSAQKLVSTLPLPVLQQNRVAFAPALNDKARALRQLRMGPVLKLALWFDEPFWWSGERESLGFLRAPDEPFPGFWTSYPVIAPLLIAWSAGPSADALAGLSDDALLERALRTLGRVFGRGVRARLRGWRLHNWQRDPLAGGAYSYGLVGGYDAHRQLARPIADTLYFAGEATDWSGSHATVHGALASGARAASEILRGESDRP